MASVKVLLRKNKQKSDGRYAVVIRITVNRRSKFKYVTWIHEKDWDEKNSQVKTSHPNSKRLNNLISKKLVEADDFMLESESMKKSFTSKDVKEEIANKGSKFSFYRLAKEHIDALNALKKYNRAVAENGFLQNMKAAHGEELLFQQIDQRFLESLKIYLMTEKGNSERTVVNHYVFIRTIFNKAIAKGLVDTKYYPFGKGKTVIRFPETIKIGLDEKEINAIEDLELEEGSTIWHTKNVFLFSFYLAGIRISDVLKMKWSDISGDRLMYQMGKNKKVVTLKIPEKAQLVIDQYKEEAKPNDFIFPELKKANLKDDKDVHAKIRTATKKFNKYLEKIRIKAKIKKKITTHIARHSFGNIAGDKVSPQMLQKLYRHSSITTTMGYQSNFIHTDTDDALDSVLDF